MKRLLNQKGFVPLSVLAVGVLIIASLTLPLVANQLEKRQTIGQRAAGSSRCAGIKYKLYLKDGSVVDLASVPAGAPLQLVIDRNDGISCNHNWDNVSLILDKVISVGVYRFVAKLAIRLPGGTKYTADFSVAEAGQYAVRLYVNEEKCQCNELKFTVVSVTPISPTSTPAAGTPVPTTSATPVANQCAIEGFIRAAGTNNYTIAAKFGGRYGNGSGRIWMAKQDGSGLAEGLAIKVGGNILPAKVYSAKTYYLLKTVPINNTPCNDCIDGNVVAEIPPGDYNLYCDVTGTIGQCSGNPFCNYQGGPIACPDWRICSEDDHDLVYVTPLIPSCRVTYQVQNQNDNRYLLGIKYPGGVINREGQARLWLEKKDRTALPVGSLYQSGTDITKSKEKVYSGKTYYLISTDNLAVLDGSISYGFEIGMIKIPPGDYYLHCDIKTGAFQCSGNPFCSANGGVDGVSETCHDWGSCSDSDFLGLKVSAPSTGTPQATNTPPPATCACPSGKPAKAEGNANCDEAVDEDDLDIWREEFLGVKTTKTADFNCDNKVDGVDFEIWRRNRN